MTKFLLKKLLPIFLIVSLVLPQLAMAQTSSGGFWSAFYKQSTQELKQEHKEEEGDKDPCKPDQQGINFGNNLRNVISRGLQQTLSQTIGNTISNNLHNIVQQQLTQQLPRIIQDGLSRQLPALIQQRMRSANVTQPTSGMLRDSIRQLLPQIIQNELPNALETGISEQLRNNLTPQFENQIYDDASESSPLLAADAGFQEMIGRVFGPGGSLFETLNSVLSALPQIVTSQIQDGGGINTTATLKTLANVAIQMTQQQITIMLSDLAQNIQRGIANDAAHGISQSGGIDKLVQQMMPTIMQVVLQGVSGPGGHAGLMGQFNNTNFNNAISNASDSFDNFNFNDWAGNNITAAIGFDLAPVSQAIAQPLALATVSGLGISGYDSAIGNLAAIGYNGPVTIDTLTAGSQLTPLGIDYAQRLGGFSGQMDGSVAQSLNAGNLGEGFPDYETSILEGAPSAMDNIGSDAADAVDSQTIASNSTLGWGSLGNQLGVGVVSGISGGIGGLVDGVPYVGGLLSPIAENMVNLALTNAFGLEELDQFGLATRVPVSDAAQHSATIQTMKNQTKTLFKPAAGTEAGIKQNNEQNKAIIKTQNEQKQVAIKDCLKNKSSLFTLKNLETLGRVLNPAAWAGSMVLTAAALKNFQKFKVNAIPDRFGGGDNNQGHSTTADINQNWNDASEEALLKASYLLKQSGNEQDAKTARLLEALTQQNRLPAATMSQSEWNKFNSNTPSLSKQEFWDNWLKAIDNDPTTRTLEGIEYALSNASQQREQATVQYLANNGVNDLVECKEWSSQVELKPTCIGGWQIKTRGSTISQRENILGIVDILKLVMASNYKEDSVGPLGKLIEMFNANGGIDPNSLVLEGDNPCPGLEPCNPNQQYQQSGYDVTNYNLIDQYSFGSNFTNSLNQAINTGVTNLGNQASGWTSQQIGSLSGYLDSGIRGRGFTNSNFSSADSCNFQCSNLVHNTVVDSLSRAGLSQEQNIILEIKARIIELLINHVSGR
ncbi:hypothetical protein IT398_01225 [Candidatus Nomurabacteria bacterium]|nr:hypothetical protein [Candidatus Nomurabacteria bacterium]